MVCAMVDLLFSDGYLAGVYDAWCPRRLRADFDFYLPRVMAAGAVLDAGCGTGMMLHEARDAGHEGRLVGLDPAPGMLAQARRRGDVAWRLGDLASATWEDEFDLIVMTGHAFQAIVSDAELRASLVSVRGALAPGGRFAFETRNPAARAWERWRPENAVTVTAPDGGAVRITTRVTTPFDGRTVTFVHSFTGNSPALPLISKSTLRFLDAEALGVLLTELGLVVEEQFGDWDEAPLNETCPEIITIARAA
jgi:SAM-dependent methyltransferase